MPGTKKTNSIQWTYATAAVLSAIASGHRYGFDVMEATGLPSGTVYPSLRRLVKKRLLLSDWEEDEVARKAGRPRRKYYALTKTGRVGLAEASKRFPMFAEALAHLAAK